MKYTILLVCLMVQAAYAAPSDKVNCSKIEEALDDLGQAQGLSAISEKYKIPSNMDEMHKRCGEMSEAIKMLRRYNKECYTSLTQQVLSAILRTRSQYNELYCSESNPETHKAALEACQCAGGPSLESIREAEKKTVLTFQVLHEASISDDKVRVRRACCAVLDGKKLFMGSVKDKCSKHEKILSEYVDSYTDEAMGLICPPADKLECDKLEAIKIDGVEAKSQFFLTPMVKLIKTLDH